MAYELELEENTELSIEDPIKENNVKNKYKGVKSNLKREPKNGK